MTYAQYIVTDQTGSVVLSTSNRFLARQKKQLTRGKLSRIDASASPDRQKLSVSQLVKIRFDRSLWHHKHQGTGQFSPPVIRTIYNRSQQIRAFGSAIKPFELLYETISDLRFFYAPKVSSFSV